MMKCKYCGDVTTQCATRMCDVCWDIQNVIDFQQDRLVTIMRRKGIKVEFPDKGAEGGEVMEDEKDKLLDELVTVLKRLKPVIVRQCGDHRECPYCHRSFIPDDTTQHDAIDAMKLIAQTISIIKGKK